MYRKIEKKAPTKSEERLIRVCRSLPVGSPRLRGRPGIFLFLNLIIFMRNIDAI